eukprot:TRINITY_DN64773_c0_g1_i1.p1 TRINITY_DN64773_c0_g1~~TRINITY_DN64773_c0_g1_i1.p1  ORF type:complete len:318 (-),score=59.91 TRINITY_DN64773_c0_g1_i1:153-989(-)
MTRQSQLVQALVQNLDVQVQKPKLGQRHSSTSSFLDVWSMLPSISSEPSGDGFKEMPTPEAEKLMESTSLQAQASLQGKTANNEACTCMPGSLSPPDEQSTLFEAARRRLAGSEYANQMEFKEENTKVNQSMAGKIQAFEEAKKDYDDRLKELRGKAEQAEQNATALKQAFQSVQSAHVNGNCYRVVADAKEDGQTAPNCGTQFEKAAQGYQSRRDAARPTCKVGAVELESLREFSLPDPQTLIQADLGSFATAKAFCGQTSSPRQLKIGASDIGRFL